MTSITVIGTGNMGTAIAGIVAKGADGVQVIDRDASKAEQLAQQVGGTSAVFGDAITGDIVVLALPYPALDDVVSTYGAQLDDKTVVDLTNPVDFATFDGLTVSADSSAAAELQAKLPGAAVVKAFNTNFAATLASGSVGGVPATVDSIEYRGREYVGLASTADGVELIFHANRACEPGSVVTLAIDPARALVFGA